MNTTANRSGFTLIELMVVVVIIAALAGMVLPRVLPASTEAKANIAKGDMAGISVALKMFKLHNDRFPRHLRGWARLSKHRHLLEIGRGPTSKRFKNPKIRGAKSTSTVILERTIPTASISGLWGRMGSRGRMTCKTGPNSRGRRH